MKILITGFDPFGGEAINPAIEAVKRLPDTIAGAEIIKVEIPTVFHKSAEVMRDKVRQHQPDVIINIGQAGGRTGITPERVAINQDDARIEDNEGNQPIDVVIQEDGENAYFSSLPIKAMVEAIHQAGLPASVSNTAGTFVCNHIMYQTLYLIDKEFPHVLGGFVHIPYMMQQVVDKPDQAAMNLDDIARGLEAAVEAVVKYKDQDIEAVGGTTH
ncbi:pyroglutamyl-peptidase I [Hutsoniella sourekii]|uniref:pyroglutamyl-peptidase I n=1 Tax=Hutsoniella sourekii TaxID=87650 RepID=UPI0004857849|nr:pyroglutamyl-peptidase I [Hutsoniella sourekii]